MYDVVIAGGGPAGLSAALSLGRARRRVLLLDEGGGRNAPASAVHGFLTRDGTTPADLRKLARDELAAYPSVEQLDVGAASVDGSNGDFRVRTDEGDHRARRVLLATGVRDDLPEIDGMGELWGRG